MVESLPPPAFLKAVDLFNRQEYFECHEILEDDLWRELPAGDEKSFYQGILQIAVGLHHLKNNNRTGATHLLARGLARLRPLEKVEPFVDWMDLPGFLQAIKTLSPTGESFPEIVLT